MDRFYPTGFDPLDLSGLPDFINTPAMGETRDDMPSSREYRNATASPDRREGPVLTSLGPYKVIKATGDRALRGRGPELNSPTRTQCSNMMPPGGERFISIHQSEVL